MIYNKILILVILVIVSFLAIQINYNGMYSHSVFASLCSILFQSVQHGFDFSLHDFTNNFLYNFIEVLAIIFLLLFGSVFRKVGLVLVGLILFLILWLFWGLTYKGIIAMSVYVLSSIPFVVICLFSIFFCVKQLKLLS